MTWQRLGWRNLQRNYKRTLITAAGLSFSYFAVVLLVGWMSGITAELVENATGLSGGQIEIHASDYRPDRSLYDTIGGRDGTDVSRLLRQVTDDPVVISATPRVYAAGLISSGDTTSAGMLWGIDPNREPTVSRFLQNLESGHIPRPSHNEIAIGIEMARQLNVTTGDELVIVAPGADGSTGNDLFTVSGTFRTGLTRLDATVGVFALEDLQLLVALNRARIHEVAVAVTLPSVADETALRLASSTQADNPAIKVASWTEFSPQIEEYRVLVEGMHIILFGIVFFVAAFGVANTMLMATHERRREFAVMLALGITPRTLILTVLYEAFSVGLIAVVIGSTVTFPTMIWLHNAPLDMSWLYKDMTFFGSLVTPTFRVEYDVGTWIQGGLGLLMTSVLAALYPAIRASRIPPADTLSGL